MASLIHNRYASGVNNNTHHTSFQPSLPSVSGSSSRASPSSRSNMAPRSFRLDAFSSSSAGTNPTTITTAAPITGTRSSPPSSSSTTSLGRTSPPTTYKSANAAPPSSMYTASPSGSTSFLTDASQAHTKKRTRVMTTEYQVARLTEVLNETMFPTTAQREQLAEELGMTPRRIQVWFQNKRQSIRRRKDEDDSTTALSRQESYTDDFEDEVPSTAARLSFSMSQTSRATVPFTNPAGLTRSPGSATLPPLDTGSSYRAHTPNFPRSSSSSNNTTPSSLSDPSSSTRSLFTSYRDPETPATPAFSPYEGPASASYGSKPSLRKSGSFLDPGMLSPAVSRSSGSGSGGLGSFSMSTSGYPPARSNSPYRSQSPYRAASPSGRSSFHSIAGPSAASAASTDLNYLSLQQSASMNDRNLTRSASSRGGYSDSSLRLPPARDLIREADALMQNDPRSSQPAQRFNRPSSFGWGR